VAGIYRFLSKVYRFVSRRAGKNGGEAQQNGPLSPEARAIQRKLHQTIKRVTDDFQGRWHFNTCISAIMELVNELYTAEAKGIPPALLARVQRDMVLLLAPFAPYLAHELWEMLGEQSNLLKAPWPKYDPELAKEEEIQIPVQVNGKLRGVVVVAPGTPEEEIIQKALADEKVQNHIFVPGKLISIVVR
jgi:leucyl-tRNA synthetase